MVKQFEIWMANLNLRAGTEAGKIRPVVIVQSDMINGTHLSTMVCPITSRVQPESYILRVKLLPDATNGLDRPSDIMIDQIRTIDNERLLKKIGMVDTGAASAIRTNLKIVMNL
jgi:mRNA interferase MazF